MRQISSIISGMITYTSRLDAALRRSAWAHEQQGQHRKGTDIPYIIHPVGVMMIASNVTDDEDTLIACLFHDILEDVKSAIYSEEQMREEFGEQVVRIVKDVTKDESSGRSWRERSQEYLDHLLERGVDEAVVVAMADKIHNLTSILVDYEVVGDELWQRFSTKNHADQVWWYESVLEIGRKRQAPALLLEQLAEKVEALKSLAS